MTERNKTIDKLRGICMLGVLGIHTGSLVLMSVLPNQHLYMLFEILSRYSVPAFFFVSGYGLFCHYKPGTEINYRQFIKKRFQSSGIPYLSWSLFYMVYFTTVVPGCIPWFSPLGLLHILFWGLACYHLYFMIILLWFYAFFPLFQKLLGAMQKYSLKAGFTALFLFQLLFNYWTMHPGITAQQLPIILQDFFTYRLNYLPLHYLFIFMLGGLAAVKEKEFFKTLAGNFKSVSALYLLSIIYIWQLLLLLLSVRLRLNQPYQYLSAIKPARLYLHNSFHFILLRLFCTKENRKLFNPRRRFYIR